MSFRVPERFRVRTGPAASDERYGCNGAFVIPADRGRPMLRIIVSDQMGWEHVSVSTQHRCPTWEEMCAVKAMFWEPEDCVVQYHPPVSKYVNVHPYCLHLWRPTAGEVVMPPTMMVG